MKRILCTLYLDRMIDIISFIHPLSPVLIYIYMYIYKGSVNVWIPGQYQVIWRVKLDNVPGQPWELGDVTFITRVKDKQSTDTMHIEREGRNRDDSKEEEEEGEDEEEEEQERKEKDKQQQKRADAGYSFDYTNCPKVSSRYISIPKI